MVISDKTYIIDKEIIKQLEAFKCTLSMIDIEYKEGFFPFSGGFAEYWLYFKVGEYDSGFNDDDEYNYKLTFHYVFNCLTSDNWDKKEQHECKLTRVTIEEYRFGLSKFEPIYSQSIHGDYKLIERPLKRILTMVDLEVRNNEIKTP